MIEYDRTDSIGRCFGKTPFGCDVRVDEHEKCGTFVCPFYKPDGCQDWVRRDEEEKVYLISPDELEMVHL